MPPVGGVGGIGRNLQVLVGILSDQEFVNGERQLEVVFLKRGTKFSICYH